MNPLNKIQRIIQITLLVASLLIAPMAAIAAEVVNINSASAAAMIENWKGIGEKKANAIVAYRKKNGKFASIDDLANVTGMGEGLIKKNRKYMSVSRGLTKPSGKSTAKKSSTAKTASKTAKSSSSTSKSTSKSSSSKSSKKDTSKAAKTTTKPKKKSTKKTKVDCKAKPKNKACKKTTKKKTTKKKTTPAT